MQEHIVPTGPLGSGRASSLSRRGVLVSAGGALAVVTVGGLLRPASAHAAAEDVGGVAILKFHTMVGVSGPFVGAGMPIRGIPGGGLPWRLDAAEGELRQDGRLQVRVRGLVLAAGPKAGTNPVPTFRAIASFEGAPAIFTAPVPASSEGDADINTRVDLPDPGFAPIIFVAAGPFVAWFAVTGNP